MKGIEEILDKLKEMQTECEKGMKEFLKKKGFSEIDDQYGNLFVRGKQKIKLPKGSIFWIR